MAAESFAEQISHLERMVVDEHKMWEELSEYDKAAISALLKRWDWVVEKLAEQGIDIMEAAQASNEALVWPSGRDLSEAPDRVKL